MRSQLTKFVELRLQIETSRRVGCAYSSASMAILLGIGATDSNLFAEK